MHVKQIPPWRSKGHGIAKGQTKAAAPARTALDDEEVQEPWERPRGGFAVISACVLGTEFTRVALFAGLLAVEFASAAARSDESLFYGLQSGRKITGFLMMTMGMVASSIAAALMAVKPPTTTARDTTLAVFFMVFAIAAFVEMILTLTVVSMECNQVAANNGDEAALWTCDRAPTFLALGVPLALPTLGGRIIVCFAAWRGRVEPAEDYEDRPAESAVDAPDEADGLVVYDAPPVTERNQGSEAAILAPAAKARAQSHGHPRLRALDAGDEDGSDNGRDNGSSRRPQLQGDDRLERCFKVCDELELKASATSAAIHGLDMYTKSLGSEVRRLTGMVEAHVTHRKQLETRITIAEQRSPSPDKGQVVDTLHVDRLRGDFENLVNEQIGSIRQQHAQFERQLQQLSAAPHTVGLGQVEAGVRSFQVTLIEAVALPQKQQSDANKLALKILRQASEVAAILCAESLDSDSRGVRELRSKYQSARDLRDLVKNVIYEKIKEVASDPGRYGIESVNRALQLSDNDSSPSNGSQRVDSTEMRRGLPAFGAQAVEPGEDARRNLFVDSYGSQSAPVHHQARMSPQPGGFQNLRQLGMMPQPPGQTAPGRPPRREMSSPISPNKFHA